MENTIQMNLFDYFLEIDEFTIQEATEVVKTKREMNVNDESIRARIYEGIDKGIFTRVSRGVYKVISQLNGRTNTCLLINGDGRDLSMIKDNSIDGIVTDHPYDLEKSLTGGNRKFATYELYRYEKRDFEEKQRVLKKGAFLVEFLPEENNDNYEYLYEIKKLAKECGFIYFTKVPWKKGDFIANTGRKSKNIEDIMIFSKGKARNLKLYAKKNKEIAILSGLEVKGKSSYGIRDMLIEHGLEVHYMSGTNGMLPTHFDVQPKDSKQKIMEAEKPVELYEQIINFISKPYELLLDQNGGSGNFAKGCFLSHRDCIIIEKDQDIFSKMKTNITDVEGSNIDVSYIEPEEDEIQELS